MLILVGTVPTAYALNHAIDAKTVAAFTAASTQTAGMLQQLLDPSVTIGDAQPELEAFVADHRPTPPHHPRPRQMIVNIRNEANAYGSLGKTPPQPCRPTSATRCTSPAPSLALLPKYAPKFDAADAKQLATYRGYLDRSTKFIPTWVKVAVALALGLGTMIGWKRIVVTVGEKIGKTHLTYAQGAAAEIIAMAHHRPGRPLRPPRQHHPRPELRRRRHHGGQRQRPASLHGPRHRPGLDLHPPRCGPALRLPLLPLQPDHPLTNPRPELQRRGSKSEPPTAARPSRAAVRHPGACASPAPRCSSGPPHLNGATSTFPPSPSKGHGFSRANNNPGPKALPWLPQAGVKPQAQRPNCLLPPATTPPAPREAPRRPRRTLSSPPTPSKPPNPLYPLAIYIFKTWHTHPHPPATIKAGNKTGQFPPPLVVPNPHHCNTLTASRLNGILYAVQENEPTCFEYFGKIGGRGGTPADVPGPPASGERGCLAPITQTPAGLIHSTLHP